MSGQLYANVDPYSFSHSFSSASTSSASSPEGYPTYQADSPPAYYYPPDTAYRASFDAKRHPSRHSSTSSPVFPEPGIEIPLVAPLRTESRLTIPHPYARLYAKKDSSKRRKIWNHVLEKQLFTPQELFVSPLAIPFFARD